MPEGKTSRVATTLRALRHRDYRLFFFGQAVSLIGTWMTRLASSWLVYRLTKDPFLLGFVNFAGLVPAFVLGPIAGAWVDRSPDLRRLVFFTQVAAMLQSFGLAWASGSGLAPHYVIVAIILLNIAQGVINAFDMPGRQALLPRMVVDPRDLANGIALNSTLFNAARLIGPGIAGALISVVGETWCFIIDGISYLAVLWAIQEMHVPKEARADARKQRLIGSIGEGLSYALGFAPIRVVLALVAVLSFLGMPYTVLLPVYAEKILGGGPSTLGWLTSAAGFGAVLGALVLARRESLMGIGRVIVAAGVMFTVALALFAYSRSLPFSLLMLMATGGGMIVQSASCNTILQTIVDPAMRGRVMSLYAMAFVGMAPFGSLLAGWSARLVGTPMTLLGCAVGCGVATGYFAWRLPRVRAEARKRMETDASTVAEVT